MQRQKQIAWTCSSTHYAPPQHVLSEQMKSEQTVHVTIAPWCAMAPSKLPLRGAAPRLSHEGQLACHGHICLRSESNWNWVFVCGCVCVWACCVSFCTPVSRKCKTLGAGTAGQEKWMTFNDKIRRILDKHEVCCRRECVCSMLEWFKMDLNGIDKWFWVWVVSSSFPTARAAPSMTVPGRSSTMPKS